MRYLEREYADTAMATRRWRPLALASVVTATLAGTVVARAFLSGGGDESPPGAAPIPSETPAAPATASVAVPPLSSSEPVLVKRVFAAGEEITVKAGIGFLSAETGALETWSPASQAEERGEYAGIQASPDGALMVSWPEGRPFIIERASGRSWQVAEGIRPLPETGHGTLMVVSVVLGDTEQLAVLNVAAGSLAPFGGARPGRDSLFALASFDGRRVVIQSGTEVNVLEVSSLRVTKVADAPDPQRPAFEPLPAGLGFVVATGNTKQPRTWFA
jgi:hypothetical protein